jgi:ABC-2 type transport system ATP-binding protein
MNVLEVRELKKSFRREVFSKRVHILNGVDFALQAGTITAFLGGNGAGKTTTLKCVLSLLRPDSGEILFFGNEPLSNKVKSRIAFLPERTFFYEYLTGLEFLQFYGDLSGKYTRAEVKRRALEIIDRVGLLPAKDKLLRLYSKGMLQKIGLAQALIHDPELVILDEPMSGLDPDGRVAVSEIIEETAKRGAAVFFSSHLIHDAEKLCDRVVMLKDGKTLFEGDLQKLLEASQQGFNLRVSQGGQTFTKFLSTEQELQAELKVTIAKGDQIIEVLPVRMSLEEIFVNKALRGTGT